MQLKSLEQSLAAISAVQQLAEQLDAAIVSLRVAIEKLPPALRKDVVTELRETFGAWLEVVDSAPSGAKSSFDLEPDEKWATPPSRVRMNKGSLAANAAAVLLVTGALTLPQLINELKQRGVNTDGDNFRAVLNTAIWRRRGDVFEKDGGFIRLRTKTIEFVDTGESTE